MNITEEKAFIYEMMKDITKERRLLFDAYFDLKKRIDFLNSLEEKGIEELSIEGYLDLHRKSQKETIINNIKRETDHQIQKIEKEYIIEESRKNEENQEKSIIPTPIISEAVHQERKKRGNLSKEKVATTTISVLKDAGVPLKLSELINRVGVILDAKISKSSFQNTTLPELMEKDKLDRPMRGFYQYRG